MKFKGGSFESIKIFPNFFSPEVLAEVGRKSIDLSKPSKMYQLGQHIHAFNCQYLLVVYPEKWIWILKSKKRRNC